MKRAFIKDSIKMFKNNLLRYICIILILVLGIAFFIGMNTIAPAMQKTAEDYLKKQNIYDIAFTSNLGYTKDDLNKFYENKNINKVQGLFEYDVLAKYSSKDIVVRVISINTETDMNKNEIFEGKDIENDNECLISSNMCDMYGYEIGDIIKVYRQDDSKVEENLSFSEFKIVGKTRSPMYISKFYGNTTLLTGELHGYIFAKETAFKMENYTAVYIKTDVDSNISRFSNEYKEKIEDILPEVEEINKKITNRKYETLYKEADENIKNGQESIKKANDYVESSKSKIKTAQLEINNKIQSVSFYVAQFYNADIIYNKVSEKNSNISKLYDVLQELEKSNYILEERCSELKPKAINLKEELNDIENNIDKNLYEIYEIENESSKFVELNKKINEKYYEFNNKNEQYKKISQEYEAKKKELEENKKNIEETKNQINTLQQELYSSFSSFQDLIAGMNNSEIIYNVNLINEAKAELIKNENNFKNSNLEEKINNYKAILNEKRDELTQFKAVTEATPLYKNSGFKSLKDDLEKIAIMGRIFPVMFFVVAALVTITTITRMIEEDRKNIGTLKALGYSNNTIINRYIIYALTAALIGVFIGTTLGSTLIVGILYESYCSLYDLPELKFSINLTYTIIALFISLISTVLVTIIITIKELKENTANLMRPKVAKEGKNILLEKIPFFWKRLSFLNKICFRNIFRYKKRLLMTLVGIAGCTALIYAGLALQSSINDIGSKEFKDIRKLSMEVYLAKETDESELKQVKKYIEEQNNVKESTPVSQQTLTVEVDDNKKDVFYIAIDSKEIEKYIGLQERKSQEKIELNDDGVIITEKLANILEVNVGDKIKIIDGLSKSSVKITGITENYLYNYIYMTPKIYEIIYGKSIKYNEFFVNIDDDLSEENETNLSNKLKENNLIASTVFEKNLDEDFQLSLKGLMTIVILFVGCASLLSFTVLINLNNINIEERARELATIKVLGFYKNELESYVFRETIFLTIFGTIFGLGIGMGILGIIIQSAEVETIFLSKDINIINLGVASVITILFTLITNLLMKKKLKNINMIDSLKSVE